MGGAQGVAFEGPGFDNPEDAALAFLDGLKSGDMDAMLSAHAVESFVDSCDHTAWLERVQAYVPTDYVSSCPYPNDDRIGQAMNIEARQATLSQGNVALVRGAPSGHGVFPMPAD